MANGDLWGEEPGRREDTKKKSERAPQERGAE